MGYFPIPWVHKPFRYLEFFVKGRKNVFNFVTFPVFTTLEVCRTQGGILISEMPCTCCKGHAEVRGPQRACALAIFGLRPCAALLPGKLS